jgi:hypothetical protein
LGNQHRTAISQEFRMPRDKAFLTELETHLRELRFEIKKLEIRAANMNGDKEAERSRRITELNDGLRTVEDKIDGLKAAEDDTLFDEIKLKAQVAWNKLNETYLEAITEFK